MKHSLVTALYRMEHLDISTSGGDKIDYHTSVGVIECHSRSHATNKFSIHIHKDTVQAKELTDVHILLLLSANLLLTQKKATRRKLDTYRN